MIPEVRQRAHPQRADIGVEVIAHERGDLLAVHRFADVTIDQRRAVGGEPDVVLGIGKLGHAGLLVRGGEAGGGPLLFAMRDDGGDFLFDARGGVVGVVVVEVGLDVLRMVDVAMETFAIVFPDEFPIGFDEVIDRFGNFCPRETLRLWRVRKEVVARRQKRAACRPD